MAIVQVGERLRKGTGALTATALFAWAGLACQHPVTAAVPTIESVSLAAAYGDGVHAYFAGDYQRSYDDLSQVIEAGTTDPRAWYFRGLAALQLGRLDESEADFATGASQEALGTGAWPVARSLERIQGRDRLKLERHRVRARVAALQTNRSRNQQRYLEIERAEPDVLRRRRPVTERAVEEGNPFEENDPSAPEPVPAVEAMPEPVDEDAAGNRPEQADQQIEELAAERENVLGQQDQQMEQEAAGVENAAGQQDGQMELEAAR